MSSESLYLRSIIPLLPRSISKNLRSLCASSPENEPLLENLIRFLSGAQCDVGTSADVHEQWLEKQEAARKMTDELALDAKSNGVKRTREDDSADATVNADSHPSKKTRLSPEKPSSSSSSPPPPGLPLMSIECISVTAPIRKKVDITIHKNVILMTNHASHAVESTILVAPLKRAFIVPTRGRSKPHWTVIIISSDIPVKGKHASENVQVIFGLDATASAPFSTATYNESGERSLNVLPKGSATHPLLQTFLSHLSIPLIEPSVDVFKSVCPGIGSNANPDGIPGVEAYRAAKNGSLWFSKEGILWGESKPCEFWAVGELLGKNEGVRIVGSGRTCTVILNRRSAVQPEDEEDIGEETEFGMVDSKEREGINEWVRNYRHLFSEMGGASPSSESEAKVAKSIPYAGPVTIHTLQQASDEEDEDFEDDVSDLDGSERLLSGQSSSGSGENGDDDDEANSGQEDMDDDAEPEEELDPRNHPLLRPGAMPKMSRAALEMAVDIVEEAFVGGSRSAEEDNEDEEDELCD